MNTDERPPLVGERLRLCAVEPGDAEVMWEMECDSGQWKLNGMTAPLSLHNLYEYALKYDADPYSAGQIRLIARRLDDDIVIGSADLYDISALNRTAFIGLYVRRELRRLGYAFEMLRVLEKYSKEILNIRVLAAKVAGHNSISRALFLKSGYIPAGRLENWLDLAGTFDSLELYQKNIGLNPEPDM